MLWSMEAKEEIEEGRNSYLIWGLKSSAGVPITWSAYLKGVGGGGLVQPPLQFQLLLHTSALQNSGSASGYWGKSLGVLPHIL